MNVGEFQRAVRGYAKRIEQQIRTTDQTNYLLGKYIIYAFNSPNKYPHKPLLDMASHKPQPVAITGQQRLAIVRELYGNKKKAK